MTTRIGSLSLRILCFIAGVVVASVGIALTASCRLGTSPISSVAYVASLLTQSYPPPFRLTFGMTTFLLNAVFFLIQLLIEKRAFPARQWLQLPATALFGAAIDAGMWLCRFIPLDIYGVKVAGVFLGAALTAAGIILELAAELVYLPGDGVVKSLAKLFKAQFGATKTCFDVFLALSAIALGLAAAGKIVGVREGTLVSAIMVGQFAQLFRPLTPRLQRVLGTAPQES